MIEGISLKLPLRGDFFEFVNGIFLKWVKEKDVL